VILPRKRKVQLNIQNELPNHSENGNHASAPNLQSLLPFMSVSMPSMILPRHQRSCMSCAQV